MSAMKAKAKSKAKPVAPARAEPSKKTHEELAERLNLAQMRTYFDALPPDQRKVLKQLRDLIRAAAPGATDSFGYGIPSVRLKGKQLVYYAAWKNHASMYPIGSSMSKDQLKGWRTSKGTVQFPYKKPLPVDLIKQLVKARIQDLQSGSDDPRGI
jgi:uncharacterized protein YdhG (YjbR/CyaY superfamily)